MLVVVVVALAFVGGVGRFDELRAFVVGVTDQCLLGLPGLVEGLRRGKHLVVDGDQMIAFIAQAQGTAGAVVEALNARLTVAGDAQAVVVGVADRRESTVVKVVKARVVTGLGEDQFLRFSTEVNRRTRQAVVDGRTLAARQWESAATVFVVNPDDAVAIDFQSMG